MATISGLWHFNEVIANESSTLYEYFTFLSNNGVTYYAIDLRFLQNGAIYYDTKSDYSKDVKVYGAGAWVNDAYRDIDFGETEKTVSDEFYSWFTANAVPDHTHNYTETGTTEPTCATDGGKTYTCECGDSYTEIIPATGHNYVNGICTNCGAIDPAGADHYQIQRETLEGIGDQVRRLCSLEETDTMGPLRMAEELENLNIELEEVYVAATTDEQIITPSEGYYGISKVVVEAVEESGSGGGAGGGDTEEDLPDAEVTRFGGKTVAGGTTYGEFWYYIESRPPWSEWKFKAPALPDDYPYWYIQLSSKTSADGVITEVLTLAGMETPAVWNDSTSYLIVPTRYVYQYTRVYNEETDENLDGTSGGWEYTGTGESGKMRFNAMWTNFNIYDTSDELVYWAACSYIYQFTGGGTVSDPVSADPLYTITGTTLNNIAMAVQKLTGGALMTPSQMAAALNSLTSD